MSKENASKKMSAMWQW